MAVYSSPRSRWKRASLAARPGRAQPPAENISLSRENDAAAGAALDMPSSPHGLVCVTVKNKLIKGS